ncbi:MAG: DUF1207 domain-containing protein [Planctomycetaceae bacterium]
MLLAAVIWLSGGSDETCNRNGAWAQGWKPTGSLTKTQYVEESQDSGPGFPEQTTDVPFESVDDGDHQWISHPNGGGSNAVVPPGPETPNSYAPQYQPDYAPSNSYPPEGPDRWADTPDAAPRRLSSERRMQSSREPRQRQPRTAARQNPRYVARRDSYGGDPFLNSANNDSSVYSRERYGVQGSYGEGEYYDEQEYFAGEYGNGTYCDECQAAMDDGWMWQLLPDSLLYKSYMAGPKETRLGTALLYDDGAGSWIMDTTFGGRVGLLRYGSVSDIPAEGWQLDVEGAAFPRFNADHNLDLQAVDLKFGLPLTWSKGPYQAKLAYSHVSSHLGDDFMFQNPGSTPSNYVKNSLVFGLGYFLTDHFRIYGEAGYAFSRSGGAEEWEFQFGSDYMPVVLGPGGAPFFACNTTFREENDFGGAINVMTGWAWHGTRTDRLIRAGVQYYNGKSSQLSFFRTHDQLLGIGLWYDF